MTLTNPHLAKLRRDHHGQLWHVTFVVEGYDEAITQVVGGKLSEGFAKLVARMSLAQKLGIRPRYITFQEMHRGI